MGGGGGEDKKMGGGRGNNPINLFRSYLTDFHQVIYVSHINFGV